MTAQWKVPEVILKAAKSERGEKGEGGNFWAEKTCAWTRGQRRWWIRGTERRIRERETVRRGWERRLEKGRVQAIQHLTHNRDVGL